MLKFSNSLAPFAVGRRANSEEWNTYTKTMEAGSAATRLGFGVPVMPGAARKTCSEIDATTGRRFLGITEAVATLPRPTDEGFARYDEVPVMEWGVIAVATEGNTTAGAQARWNTVSKRWTGAAQSATVVTIPGATFEETTTAPGIQLVRLRKTENPSVTVSG